MLVDEGEHGPDFTGIAAAERTRFSRRSVEMIGEPCVTEGLDCALERKKRVRERSQRLDGEGEARLISLAYSDSPAGQARWTLHMLADKLVGLKVAEPLSHECVQQVLKNTIKPRKKRCWTNWSLFIPQAWQLAGYEFRGKVMLSRQYLGRR